MARYCGRHRLRALLPRVLTSALIATVILVTAAYLLPSLPGRLLHAPLLLLASAGATAGLVGAGIALRTRTGSELAGYATEAVLPVAALALVLVPLARAETVADPGGSTIASDPMSRAERTPAATGRTSGSPLGEGGSANGHRSGDGSGRSGQPRSDDSATEPGDAASHTGRDTGPDTAPETGPATAPETVPPADSQQPGNGGHRNDGPGATAPTTAGERTGRTGGPGGSDGSETPGHSQGPTPPPTRTPAPSLTPTSTSTAPDPTRTSDSDITIIARGHLIGLGGRVSGTVELAARPDGSQRIILDSDFSGGSLDAGVHLYLTPGLSPIPGGTLLGPLSAVTGRQGYPVPQPVKAGRPVTLLLVPAHGLTPDALAVLRP